MIRPLFDQLNKKRQALAHVVQFLTSLAKLPCHRKWPFDISMPMRWMPKKLWGTFLIKERWVPSSCLLPSNASVMTAWEGFLRPEGKGWESWRCHRWCYRAATPRLASVYQTLFVMGGGGKKSNSFGLKYCTWGFCFTAKDVPIWYQCQCPLIKAHWKIVLY